VNISFKSGMPQTATGSPTTWRMRSIAIAAAAVVNVALAFIARAGTGQFPMAEINGDVQTIAVAQVVVTTVLVGLIAWAMRAGLDRISSHTERAWSMLALVVLAISLLGPLGSGVDSASKVALAGMHVATAALLIPVMSVSARR
jgi:uncharacterized protein DUF6069